ARNYLLPRGLAVSASSENAKQIEHEQRVAVALGEKQRKIAQGAAAQIEGLTIEIPMQVGEGEKLYGSVTARDIIQALASKGISLDKKKLHIPDTIRALGEYQVSAKIASEVSANFKVVVVAS